MGAITNNPIPSGAAFTLDMGKDAATTNQVQKVALCEPVGATFIIPAQEGTDATGVTPPAGAVGIRGWLSSIWNKLNTSIAVTGTVSLGAGTQVLGSIIGRSSMPLVAPAVTSNGAYAAGNQIGGLMTFAVGGAGTGGTLMDMRVTSKSVLTTSLNAFVFTTNPAASTWTDKTTPAINTADIASLLCVVPLTNPIPGIGTATIWSEGELGYQFLAANLYVVLVLVSAATLTSASVADITVELGIKVD